MLTRLVQPIVFLLCILLALCVGDRESDFPASD